MLLKMAVRSLLGFLVLGLLLFLPAGTLAWPEAWVFLVLLNGCGLAMGLWLRRRDPGLLAERMKSPLHADQRPRDRAVMATMLLASVAWLVAMGADRRFGWSHVPFWVQALGAALVVVAFWGCASVLRANSFAAATVRVQGERGQTVVSTGPYAVVRHPMYAYALLLMAGAPLLLGSLWGLAGLVVFLPLLAARALGEEAVLAEGLPGYRDYASRVRSRLLPGIW
jgi:protein-S-isoprenylcysteine O-methyltransferase Ste14